MTNHNHPCPVDTCKAKATFASPDFTVFACTRHARRGFTVFPTVMAMRLGDKPRMYSEGLGNLKPITAMQAVTHPPVQTTGG